MKEYSVSVLRQGAKIDFSSLPVAKITHYPLEAGSYKPYSQGILAISYDQIGICLTSFEVSPNSESMIGGIFYLFKNQNIALEVWATPNNVMASVIENDQTHAISFTSHSKSGEDLQGKYWGTEIFIPIPYVKNYGIIKTLEDVYISGNFFKILDIDTPHYGAFAEAEFKDFNYHKEKMANFKLVSY